MQEVTTVKAIANNRVGLNAIGHMLNVDCCNDTAMKMLAATTTKVTMRKLVSRKLVRRWW